MVEGLNEIKKTSDLIIKEIIANGDSSTYAAIQEKVPRVREVIKIEANHACKCLQSSLEKLVEAKPHYKGINKLSEQTRVRLTTAVRCQGSYRKLDIKIKDFSRTFQHQINFFKDQLFFYL